MTLTLPVPHKLIKDAIQVEGVTTVQILKVAEEQAECLRAAGHHLEGQFKNHFTAAALGKISPENPISPGTLGALRTAVLAYLKAETELAYDPTNIQDLLTVGALEPNCWQQVLRSLHGRGWRRETTYMNGLLASGSRVQSLSAPHTYEMLRVLHAFDFHTSDLQGWINFIQATVSPYVKKSAPILLSYLGDKAAEAAHLFEQKKPLSEIR